MQQREAQRLVVATGEQQQAAWACVWSERGAQRAGVWARLRCERRIKQGSSMSTENLLRMALTVL